MLAPHDHPWNFAKKHDFFRISTGNDVTHLALGFLKYSRIRPGLSNSNLLEGHIETKNALQVRAFS